MAKCRFDIKKKSQNNIKKIKPKRENMGKIEENR